MDLKSSLVLIMGDVVEKAMRAAGKDNPDEIKVVKNNIEDVIKDKEVTAKIDDLVKSESKTYHPFDRLGAFVRPAVTLMLALTFVFLIVSPFLEISFLHDLDDKSWDKIFASFMGVFGTIIGFWFGERTALKVPGGEQAKEIAAAARKDAAKAREEAAKAPAKAKSINPEAQG